MKYTSNSLEEFQKIANEFAENISSKKDKATIVGLYGELGAGKTTFTQTVAKNFGVEEIVTSPTFVIEKIYPVRNDGRKRPISNGAGEFTHLIHIDAYRLEKSSELLHLGWQEIISDPHNLILIEWPEKVADIMPKHIKIGLKTLENEDSRSIDISYH